MMEIQRCKVEFSKLEREIEDGVRWFECVNKESEMKESFVQQLKRENMVFKKELDLVFDEFGDYFISYVFDIRIFEVELELF